MRKTVKLGRAEQVTQALFKQSSFSLLEPVEVPQTFSYLLLRTRLQEESAFPPEHIDAKGHFWELLPLTDRETGLLVLSCI